VSINKAEKRWLDAYPFIGNLPIDQKRMFFANALKYFLDSYLWNEQIPIFELVHPNLMDMISSFNQMTSIAMNTKPNLFIQFQNQVIFPHVYSHNNKKLKRRIRKKRISRFTNEMIFIIKSFHPAFGKRGISCKERTKGMLFFSRFVRRYYLNKDF
jgi:hypothetical protein